METTDIQQMTQAMNKAKVEIMRKPDATFFTTVCFSLIHKFSDTIPTACTNGKTVLYNPQFFLKQDKEQQAGLMLHETLHVAFFHMDPQRRKQRDPKRWNIACDHVINLLLLDRGFKLPNGGYADPKYRGMGAEQVYDLLDEDTNANSSPEMEDLDESDFQKPDGEIQKEIEDILVRAAMQSKMAGDKPGSIPGEIEIFLQKLLNPKLPWQQILQKYLHSFNKSDYSFYKPNRRFFPQYILPGLHAKSMNELAFVIDVSGSVSDEEFLYFVSEAASLLKMMKPKKMTLIQFDWGIRGINEITSVEELRKVKFTGRGGTAISPVIKWINEHKPTVSLIFTDGYFTMPETKIEKDVVWLIHDNKDFQAKQGKVIHYQMEDAIK